MPPNRLLQQYVFHMTPITGLQATLQASQKSNNGKVQQQSPVLFAKRLEAVANLASVEHSDGTPYFSDYGRNVTKSDILEGFLQLPQSSSSFTQRLTQESG
ncbi:hypothetical protein AVEN_54673-1 [Araneus ventricosus]|uniref:Uncharacterized protein n=1 Tax=Araneus ventricosus TaxID=182803 RepID=A0A4Y2BMW4_ARAVE|nr:hypothetical protein AVEN_54673-1 [Araneus ventricosus]